MQYNFVEDQNRKIKEAYDALMDLRNYYEILRVSQMMIPQLNDQFQGQGQAVGDNGSA